MFIDETDVTGTLMNRVYRILWNASRQAWMVAAELTRGKTKSQIGRKKKLLKMISGSLVVSTSLLFTGNALAAPNEYIWDVQDGSWTTGSNWRDGIAPDNLVSNSEVIIDNNGSVGIGTSTPAVPFHVYRNNVDSIIAIDQAGTKNDCGVQFKRATVEKWFIGMNDTDEDLIFRNNGFDEFGSL